MSTYLEIVQTKLNNMVSGKKYMGKDIVFYVHKNIGEYKAKQADTQAVVGKYIINAVLSDEASTPIAVAGLNAFEKKQSLDVVVPVDLTATDYTTGIYTDGIEYVTSILENFTMAVVGETSTVTVGSSQYAYVLNATKPYIGTEQYIAQIGKAVAVSTELTWQVFDGVLGNNIEVWVRQYNTGSYEKALVLDGSIERTRTGDTSQYDGQTEMKTSITQQGLVLKCQIPFKRTGVSVALVNDMLTGSLDKVYDVKYIDGVTHKSSGTPTPLVKQMVATSIAMPLTAGAPLSLTVTFAIAALT